MGLRGHSSQKKSFHSNCPNSSGWTKYKSQPILTNHNRVRLALVRTPFLGSMMKNSSPLHILSQYDDTCAFLLNCILQRCLDMMTIQENNT